MTLALESPDGLLDIIGACYEAGSDPGLWPDALRLIARAVSARAALLVEIDWLSDTRRLLAQHGLSPRAATEYRVEALKSDPSLPISQSTKRSPQLLALPGPLSGDLTLRLLMLATDHTSQYLVIRRDAARDGVQAALDLIDRLAPHLARTARIAEKTTRLTAVIENTNAAFEALETGIALFDRDGRLILSNHRAKQLLEQNGQALTIDLRAAATLSTDDLRRPFGLQNGKANGETCSAPTRAATPTRTGRIRYELLSEPSTAPYGVPVFMLLASPSDGINSAGRLAKFKQLYGLTPAESKLAAALAAGKSLSEVADEFNISKYTVRAQLRQIFAKTDTHRQAELVKLLLSPPQSEA